KERCRFRVWGRRWEVVEGDGVDKLRERPRASLSAEMIEAHGRCDAEEPPLGSSAVVEVVGTLDGARDGLLAQVVGLRTSPGHAIAVRPQALAAPLDGGEDGRGAAQRHGSRERGRLRGPRRYGPGRVGFIAPSWWFDQAGAGCRGCPGDRIAPPELLRRRGARRGRGTDRDELSALPSRPAVTGRLGDRARDPLAGRSRAARPVRARSPRRCTALADREVGSRHAHAGGAVLPPEPR